MAVLADFRAQFPEFGPNVTDALINLTLAAATLELDLTVWGQYGVTGALTRADQALMLLTAHRLASGPFGQNAKMVINPRAKSYERTTYGGEFLRLMRAATSGYRVA